MKIKYIIILAGLALAFAAASVWAMLSNGRNARAVRAKYRLGGLMLTITGMLTMASCEDGIFGQVTCYDPVIPQKVVFGSSYQNGVKIGDIIGFKVTDLNYGSYAYELVGEGVTIIQTGTIEPVEGNAEITINNTEYRGCLILSIYGIQDGNERVYMGGIGFELK